MTADEIRKKEWNRYTILAIKTAHIIFLQEIAAQLAESNEIAREMLEEQRKANVVA